MSPSIGEAWQIVNIRAAHKTSSNKDKIGFYISQLNSKQNLYLKSINKIQDTATNLHNMQKNIWDQELLEELSCTMEDASICGLGQAAPNPLRSVIKYFLHEVE